LFNDLHHRFDGGFRPRIRHRPLFDDIFRTHAEHDALSA
jgi:hypothetical protein